MSRNASLPLVSVVMPVYNGAKYVAEAIDSVLAQTYPNIEIIVVNDGSIDNTDEILKSYGNKIHYFKKENGGVSSALNFGIRAMRGEYFAWLSHDDTYEPNKIELAINALKGAKKDAVVFSNFKLFDKDGKTITTTNFEDRAKKSLLNGSGIYPVLRGMVNGDAILIHKDVFKTCGIFDEKLKTSSDYDLWYRIFSKFDHVFIPDAPVKYRIHAEQDTNKHPEYHKESDNLNFKTISSLTDNQIRSFGMTPFQIYSELYTKCTDAKLERSSKLAYDLAKKSFEKIKHVSISVLMPVHNCEKYIDEAVSSLLRSEFSDYELIIIDDNSTDGTLSKIHKLMDRDFRIKLISNKSQLGISKSLNKALKVVRGKYITRLDADDTITVDRLMRQYLMLENDENIGFCATNISIMDPSSFITTTNTYMPCLAPTQVMAAFVNPVPNATIMYRMDLIRRHHLEFDDLKVAEDYSFLLKYSHFANGTMINLPLYNYRVYPHSSFHNNLGLAMQYSLQVSSEYAESFLPGISKTDFFALTSVFATHPKNYDIYAVLSDAERFVLAAKSKLQLSDEDCLRSFSYITSQIFSNISQVNNYSIARRLYGKAKQVAKATASKVKRGFGREKK